MLPTTTRFARRRKGPDTGEEAPPTVHGRTAWLRFWPWKERIEDEHDDDNDNDSGKQTME
jgi:hypothetical protein